jgi:hypothetical protein
LISVGDVRLLAVESICTKLSVPSMLAPDGSKRVVMDSNVVWGGRGVKGGPRSWLVTKWSSLPIIFSSDFAITPVAAGTPNEHSASIPKLLTPFAILK